MLAALVATGRGTDRNPVRAASILQPLADSDDAEAAYLLANMYAGIPELSSKRDEAIRYATRAAEAGKTEAMVTVASLHSQGIGTPANEVLAQEWLRKAEATGRIRITEQH